MELHLLLSRAGSGRPVLERPLSLEHASYGPLPPPPPEPSHLVDLAAEADSLPAQRWALVVPEGEHGQRLRSLLEPLRRFRSEQQKAEAEVYVVPPGQDRRAASEFRRRTMQPDSKRLREQARYVLLAGGPEVISPELQEELASDGASFVGRLPLEAEEVEAYVSKVVEREKRASGGRRPRAILLSADEGDGLTQHGHDILVGPVARACHRERELGYFPVSEVVEERLETGALERLMELARATEPTVFFTLSHGVGAPRGGWAGAEEQWRQQGCMSLGGGIVLTPEAVRQRPFMPGGMWFYFACFGAGTPRRSAYLPWLEVLYREGHLPGYVVEDLRETQPLDGRPFAAALPRAALANPEGPLAIIAHMDLAWLHAFHEETTGHSHPNRLLGVLASLVNGRRVGAAMALLSRFALQVEGALHKEYQAEAEASASGQPSPKERILRARWWMERHDLRNYVLLGDPAARLVVGGMEWTPRSQRAGPFPHPVEEAGICLEVG